MSSTLPELFSVLPEGHVLHTMIAEHQVILGFLSDLNRHRAELLQGPEKVTPELLGAVGDLGEALISAENHHLREERVLFPALEERGITGPPQAMAQEHEWLRPAKRAIVSLAGSEGKMPLKALMQELDAKMTYLNSLLSSHISKENQILYPMAYQVIAEPSEWEQLKLACDAIGYCPFTPGR